MGRIADVMKNVPISGTRKFYDIAAKMEGVVSLSVGEPDFKTPDNIGEAAIAAIQGGKTKYTTNAGLPALRDEIAKYMRRRFSLEYNINQILTTVGSSAGVFAALRAVIDPGDEVLFTDPCYVSYKPTVYMAGGVPVMMETHAEDGFKLRPEALLKKLSPKTKALVLNYPNNPTGAIMERDDLERLAEILRERDIIVISDEIYSELTYDKKHFSIAQLDGMYDKTLVLNGFSKSYSMTGWRLGYACGPEDIIHAMLMINQYVTMSAPTISQHAGIEALERNDGSIAQMLAEYDSRRRLMLGSLRAMGLECAEPFGAFYMFPSIKKTGMSSDDFTLRLLNEQRVEVISGSGFGACGEGFIRLSYAYSTEKIEEGMRRIAKFLG